MSTDSVLLHRIFSETRRKLEEFLKSVREQKHVMEASSFVRWLQFSGIFPLLEQSPQKPPLLVDVAILRNLVTDVVFECGEAFRNGKADPKYAASDIAEINRKLDVIAAHVSTLSPPLTATAAVGDSAEPALFVLQGGRMSGAQPR